MVSEKLLDEWIADEAKANKDYLAEAKKAENNPAVKQLLTCIAADEKKHHDMLVSIKKRAFDNCGTSGASQHKPYDNPKY